MATWYLGSNKHTAIAQWAAATAYSIGDIRRQLATPTKDNERAFRCTTAGTSGGAEPSWTLTKGGTTNDNGVIWTEVTGNSTYGWAAAAARQKLFLNGGSSWAAAGDTVYRHASHAEAIGSGSETWTSPGTAASPLSLITVNDGLTARTTGAKATQTGNSSITFYGFVYDYGMEYDVGNGGALGATVNFYGDQPTWWRLDNCFMNFSNNTGASSFAIGFNTTGLDDRVVELINTNVSFGDVGAGFSALSGGLIWKGGTLGGTAPTTLIKAVSVGPCLVFYGSGLDLSVMGSGKTLVALNTNQMGEVLLENCKLGASVAYTTGTHPGQGGLKVRIVNCDSGATSTNYHSEDYAGAIDDETVIILNSTVSRKLVSSANSKLYWPLVLDDIVVYNSVTGSAQTATVEIVTDGVTLTDAECWVEVESLSNASFPIAGFTDDRISDPTFGTPANQTTSTAAWTTTGLASPTKQKLAASFTAQLAGPVRIRVMLAKPSTTVYVDPQVTIA